MQSISLEEWEKLGEVKGYIEDYMAETAISDQIEEIVNVLLSVPSGSGIEEDVLLG